MQLEKIGSQQFFVMALLYTVGSAILLIPHPVIKFAKQDAWISSLFALLFGLFLVYIYLKIYSFFPGYTYTQILEHTFGLFFGKLLAIFTLVSFHLLLLIVIIRGFADFIVAHLLNETPVRAIIVLLFITMAYAVKQGMEVIARTAQILVPIVIFFFLFSMVFLLKEGSIENFLPVTVNGWIPIVRGAIPNLGFPFMDVFVLVILFNYVTPREKLGKSLYLGVFIGGMMVVIAIFYSIFVLGVEYSATKIYIPYVLGAQIKIGNFIQRVEVIVASIWIISTFIKICIILLTLVIGTKHVFRTKGYRIFVLPTALLAISLLDVFIADRSYWDIVEKIWPFYASIFTVIIPIVVLLINGVKKVINGKEST